MEKRGCNASSSRLQSFESHSYRMTSKEWKYEKCEWFRVEKHTTTMETALCRTSNTCETGRNGLLDSRRRRKTLMKRGHDHHMHCSED